MTSNGSRRYATAIKDGTGMGQAFAATPPTPPADLTPEQATLFRELIESKAASYWRTSDGHLLAQYVRLWSSYLEVSAAAAKEKPITMDGRPAPKHAVAATLYRQADALIRRLGLTPFQRLEARGGSDAREAKREDERARTAKRASADGLLAGPTH